MEGRSLRDGGRRGEERREKERERDKKIYDEEMKDDRTKRWIFSLHWIYYKRVPM